MKQAQNSRWLDWQPKADIKRESARTDPTKPTKPVENPPKGGFDGFVGAIQGHSRFIKHPAAVQQGESIKPKRPYTLPTKPTKPPSSPGPVLEAQGEKLASICRETLAANPAATKLDGGDREWIAEHLRLAVLNWLGRTVQPEDVWEAICPRGHGITQGIFVKCLAGWCCDECQQVYPPEHCRYDAGAE